MAMGDVAFANAGNAKLLNANSRPVPSNKCCADVADSMADATTLDASGKRVVSSLASRGRRIADACRFG